MLLSTPVISAICTATAFTISWWLDFVPFSRVTDLYEYLPVVTTPRCFVAVMAVLGVSFVMWWWTNATIRTKNKIWKQATTLLHAHSGVMANAFLTVICSCMLVCTCCFYDENPQIARFVAPLALLGLIKLHPEITRASVVVLLLLLGFGLWYTKNPLHRNEVTTLCDDTKRVLIPMKKQIKHNITLEKNKIRPFSHYKNQALSYSKHAMRLCRLVRLLDPDLYQACAEKYDFNDEGHLVKQSYLAPPLDYALGLKSSEPKNINALRGCVAKVKRYNPGFSVTGLSSFFTSRRSKYDNCLKQHMPGVLDDMHSPNIKVALSGLQLWYNYNKNPALSDKIARLEATCRVFRTHISAVVQNLQTQITDLAVSITQRVVHDSMKRDFSERDSIMRRITLFSAAIRDVGRWNKEVPNKEEVLTVLDPLAMSMDCNNQTGGVALQVWSQFKLEAFADAMTLYCEAYHYGKQNAVSVSSLTTEAEILNPHHQTKIHTLQKKLFNTRQAFKTVYTKYAAISANTDNAKKMQNGLNSAVVASNTLKEKDVNAMVFADFGEEIDKAFDEVKNELQSYGTSFFQKMRDLHIGNN